MQKAQNRVSNRVCVLKSIPKSYVPKMKHSPHLISEHDVLRYLNSVNKTFVSRDSFEEPIEETICPFFMTLYSTFQDKENLYFELEYISGCTLLSQIRKANLSVTQNMPFYALEVAMALEYLHSQSIIYRDLKPENLILSMENRGHIKFVDFGFAKIMKQSKTKTNCGTPAYIAPEILRGFHDHGREVDVWSLGVLMVEISSGSTPFLADTTVGIYD